MPPKQFLSKKSKWMQTLVVVLSCPLLLLSRCLINSSIFHLWWEKPCTLMKMSMVLSFPCLTNTIENRIDCALKSHYLWKIKIFTRRSYLIWKSAEWNRRQKPLEKEKHRPKTVRKPNKHSTLHTRSMRCNMMFTMHSCLFIDHNKKIIHRLS